MGKVVKLDPKKVTYNGKSLDLVIPDRDAFLEDLRTRQEKMEKDIKNKSQGHLNQKKSAVEKDSESGKSDLDV